MSALPLLLPPRRARRLVVLAFLVFVLVLPVSAAPASPGAPPAGWPPRSELARRLEPIRIPQGTGIQESLQEANDGVSRFLRGRPAWKATVDPFSGGLDRAFGDGIAVTAPVEGAGSGEALGRAFLQRYRDLLAKGLDISPESLPFDERASTRLADPEVRLLEFGLRKDGIPVLGAGVTLAARGDRVFFLATSALAPVTTSSVPRVSPTEALAIVSAFAAVAAPALVAVREPSLAFQPFVDSGGKLRHRLAWMLEVRPPGARPWDGWIAYVDAHDAEVLAFFPEARDAGQTCSADPTQARGSVLGGVRANRADDAEKSVALPFVTVVSDDRLASSDRNGRYGWAGGIATSSLEGDFFRIHCDACTGPVQPMATADPSGTVDFGTGGSSQPSPVPGNGSSTPADRSTYFHLNEARLLLEKWDNTFFGEVDAFVNIDSTCNAFSSAYMLGFFRAGGNCRNTGEIRDVIQHELGHTWDRTDGTGIADGGLSEWKGDVLAFLAGGDSCIGESFFVGGGPAAFCSGVRDINERAPGRLDHPATPAVCPTCATITRAENDCAGEPHCVGEIPGQATWHLYQNLLTGADFISGAPLPAGNPGRSAEQARWILERLLIAGGPAMRTWDPSAAGTSIYDAMLLTDDDDGNLANGTPHAAYINAAFEHHGIAESPPITDAPECSALPDPEVTASIVRDPSTGLPAVRLDWIPIGGATTFDVLRNGRPGDAFLPLARSVAAGPLLDSGVQIGQSYRYWVAAVRMSGCATVSPGGNIETAQVNPAELRIAVRTIAEAPTGSDGDGRIEPGERARIAVTLREMGGAEGATNVRSTLTSAAPRTAPVVAAGPVSFGTVSPGGTAAGATPFEVLVGPSIPCGGRTHFVLSITADDGCWLDGIDVPVATAADGCAVGGGGFVEVVPGSAAVVSASGDGDGIVDNCETATVAYQIRNSGLSASGPVTSSASTTHGGVTFVPRSGCAVASLDPGQSVACGFTFSVGGATPAGIPFTIAADSAANPAASKLEFVLPAETNPPGFGTVAYDFESGAQGWSLQQFTMSFRHVSGLRSIHSGSTATPAICGRATSPTLLLHPSTTSMLSMQVYGDIEPLTDRWYDRANVHLVDLDTGVHAVLLPFSGLAYNASGNPDGGLCHVPGQQGWAGPFATWNGVGFDLSPWSGRRVRIEINYDTDDGDDREGLYIDDVAITNAAVPPPPDAQGDACAVLEPSGAGALPPLIVEDAGGGRLLWSWQDLGPAFQYSLYAGTLGSFYDHGASPLVCQGVGAGIACDGVRCAFEGPSTSVPEGDLYFLVTATAYGIEGASGFADSGAPRDPLESTCAP